MKYVIRDSDLEYCIVLQVPVSHTECAEKPDDTYVLASAWATDPLNTSVCWRVRSSAEVHAIASVEYTGRFSQNKALKVLATQIFKLRKVNEPGLTVSAFTSQLILAYKSA